MDVRSQLCKYFLSHRFLKVLFLHCDNDSFVILRITERSAETLVFDIKRKSEEELEKDGNNRLLLVAIHFLADRVSRIETSFHVPLNYNLFIGLESLK